MSAPPFSLEARECRPYEAEGEVAALFVEHSTHPDEVPYRMGFAHETGGRLITTSDADGNLLGFLLYSPKPYQKFVEYSGAKKPAYIIFNAIEKKKQETLSLVEAALGRCFLEDARANGFDYMLFGVHRVNTNAHSLYERYVKLGWAMCIGSDATDTSYAADIDQMLRGMAKLARLVEKFSAPRHG